MGVLIVVLQLSMLLLLQQQQLSRAFQSFYPTTTASSLRISLRSSRLHRVFLSDVRRSMMTMTAATGTSSHTTDDQPTSDKDHLKGYMARGASSLIIPLAATLGLSNPLTTYAAVSSGPTASSSSSQTLLGPQEEGPATRVGDSLDRYLESLPLGKDAYTTLGGGASSPLITCKVLNGMWQVQ